MARGGNHVADVGIGFVSLTIQEKFSKLLKEDLKKPSGNGHCLCGRGVGTSP